MRICTIEGCQDRLYAVGLCNKHYLRKKIHGDPNHVEVIKFDTETRFWSKVEKTDGCWNWKGFLRTGYGCMSIKGKQIPAHRYAYELLVGKIPEGKHIDHLCRNRACVNPVHLEPVTLRENVLRGEGLTAKNADKTHCPNGHEYDRKYWNNRDKSYQRACSTCSRAKDSKQRYQEKKAKDPNFHPNIPNKDKTHCPHGHLLDGICSNGSRYCKTCKKEKGKQRREKIQSVQAQLKSLNT